MSDTCGLDLGESTVVYQGYGNIVRFPVTDQYTTETPDMATATEVAVCVAGTASSSEDVPAYVSWVEEAGTWYIDFQPGMFAGIAVGEVDASIIVYTTTHTNGLVLTHTFKLNVVDPC